MLEGMREFNVHDLDLQIVVYTCSLVIEHQVLAPATMLG